MNLAQALLCLDTGETVLYQGIPCIVISVETKRMLRYHGYTPYCTGNRFYTCTLIQKKGGNNSTLQVRPEQITNEIKRED